MSWWAWFLVIGYVAGWMYAFRTRYLASREVYEREVDECKRSHHIIREGRCQSAVHAQEFDITPPVALATAWPAVVVGMTLWKIMFPRGVVTAYERQKQKARELDKRQQALEAVAKEIIETSKSLNLRVPEGLGRKL